MLFHLVARPGDEEEKVKDELRAIERRLGWTFAQRGGKEIVKENRAVELVRVVLVGEDHRRLAREVAMQFPVGATRTWSRTDLSVMEVEG